MSRDCWSCLFWRSHTRSAASVLHPLIRTGHKEGGVMSVETRSAVRPVPTFVEAAEAVTEMNRLYLRRESAGKRLLEIHVHPHLGSLRLSDIEPSHIAAVLDAVRMRFTKSVHRVRSCIASVLRWAVAHGFRPDNPCDAVLISPPRWWRHAARALRCSAARGGGGCARGGSCRDRLDWCEAAVRVHGSDGLGSRRDSSCALAADRHRGCQVERASWTLERRGQWARVCAKLAPTRRRPPRRAREHSVHRGRRR